MRALKTFATWGLALAAAASLAGAWGTDSVEVADHAELPAAAVSAPSSTTSRPAASTTIAPSTTTAATTTVAPVVTVPLAFDEEDVPINGQTSGVVVSPEGWVLPVLHELGDDRWKVWTPCGREADVSAGRFVASVDFVIDPGHGGSETGAVGPGGTREADLNLQVARRIASRLEADGYRVLMTRESDQRVPIVTRAEIALALDPVAFISVHHNAGTEALSPEPGTEMFFQLASAESGRLAGLLYEETRAVLAPLGTQWFALSDAGAMGRPNRDGGDYYGVLRRPAGVPSVIAEFAYITNAVEEELLNRTDVQDALAGAVRSAIARFMSTNDPGSGFTEDPIFRGYGPSGAGQTTDCTDPVLG